MTNDLGRRLRASREAVQPEITQRDAAKVVGKSPSAINLWEAGKTEPNMEALAKLSTLYKVSADWLLGVEDDLAKRKMVVATPKSGPPVFLVPVVPISLLMRWQLDATTEMLQTMASYPPGTAAGVLVSSDALQSDLPTGAYAVVSKGHEARTGQIVLAALSKVSDPVFRRLIKEGSETLLLADDTRYPSYKLTDTERIIGRVTEVCVRRMIA